jgi:hypothetical protein
VLRGTHAPSSTHLVPTRRRAVKCRALLPRPLSRSPSRSLSLGSLTMAEQPSSQLPSFCRCLYLATMPRLPAASLVTVVAETAYSEPPCGHRTEPPPVTVARPEPAVVGRARAPLWCGQPQMCPHTSSPPPAAILPARNNSGVVLCSVKTKEKG